MGDGRTRVMLAGGGVALLAIGVVLGSGPLRAALLGGTGEKIDSLQSEADAARADAEEAESVAQAGRDYLDAVAPRLLADLAPDANVLLIDLGGDAAADLEARIVLTGATVAGTVSLGPDWTDAAQAPFRDALADQVASTVAGVDDAGPEQVLAHAFVQGATGGASPSGDGTGGIDAGGTDRGAVLWDLLSQAGLATGTPGSDVSAIVLTVAADGPGEVIADAAVDYDLPLLVVGAPAAVAPYEGRDDLATVGAVDWTYGAVTAAATVAETLAGTYGHYRVDDDHADVPEVLGGSGMPTGTSG